MNGVHPCIRVGFYSKSLYGDQKSQHLLNELKTPINTGCRLIHINLSYIIVFGVASIQGVYMSFGLLGVRVDAMMS